MQINFNKLPIFTNNTDSQKTGYYPNLAPLKYDTISFSGSRKLIGASMKNAPSGKTCQDVSANAEPAGIYLSAVLDRYLLPYSEEGGNKHPILTYKTRIKSGTSIREKVASKYQKIRDDEYSKFAKEMAKLLSSYYVINENATEKGLEAEISEILSYLPNHDNLSPFCHPTDFLDDVFCGINAFGYIDRDDYTVEEEDKIFDDLAKKLYELKPDDTVADGRHENPETVKGVKYYANDIVGARVVMLEKDDEYVAIVLDALRKAVKDKTLKIKSIESNIPDPKRLPGTKQISDYQYGSDRKIAALAKEAGVEVEQNQTHSGYMALHIDVDLSGDFFKTSNRKYNGYSGEIQIMGEDVERLKDVEDLCYKMKDEKGVVHVAYQPFKDYFRKYYTEETEQAFNDYTYALYLHQRSIPSGVCNDNSKFPSIEELGFAGKVPPELDFNELRKLKQSCDAKYKEMQEADKQQYSKGMVTDLFSKLKELQSK